jgi:type I restriction-modification system DNA methylase subunit
MPAPQAVLTLIENFERNLDAYRNGQYNETQVRRDFIDPLFKALGWDMDNSLGYAEAYRDVIHEDTIKVGISTRAPDYSFRIGGARKFFLEAKKPSVNLKDDIEPAFQLRRYGWSAKLSISVLTDFEEFAVSDCRIKPDKNDKASKSRLFYCTFRDYAEKWDEIAAIFSKDAVLKGSFDKFVTSTKGKRGTSEVDSAFLQEIEGWRDLLARNIALRNDNLSQRELNFAVQQTIDRIIFLRICEDRGIEPYGRLMALQNGSNVYSRLRELFHDADDRYNSGLFHFKREKGRAEAPDELTLHLAIDDKPLKEIFKNLYYPDSPYEFSVLGADILCSVYEQFLGKVIRLTSGNRAVVEDKPEVKKAGGVFYTPAYIVQYIVQHTVGKLLEGKTSKQAEGIRILDPACGSGSFLIGAYQYLLDWHLSCYQEDTEKFSKGKAARIRPGAHGAWRLTTAEKKRILLEHIYGVDIDAQAVEVTKLSLLLKMLEGESDQTLTSQMKLFHERILPDLEHNIQCGNSLIGPDFYDGQLDLDNEAAQRINVFDWQAAFPQVFKIPPTPPLSKGGNPQPPLQKGVERSGGGFDAVIGNPPYGGNLSEVETSYLLSHYPLQNYKLDTYLLFLEKGLALSGKKATLGFIIPNTWLLNLTSTKIRSFVFSNTQIDNIVHYGRAVFPKVTVDTEVITLRNESANADHSIRVEIIGKDNTSNTYAVQQDAWKNKNGAPVNLLERPEYGLLAAKLRSYPIFDEHLNITQGAKPFQVGKGKPAQTQAILDTKPFVSATKVDRTFRPLLRGSLIQKYRILWDGDYYISFGDWLAEPRYSASHDAPTKIVIRQTGDSLIATLDNQQFIVRDNLYTILPKSDNFDLRYALGVLNSKLLNWFYQNIVNPEAGEALAQVKRGHIARLPFVMPAHNEAHYDKLVALVEKMLALYQQLAAAKTPQDITLLQRQTAATDQQIDQLVYVLYDLNDEEIALVEGA